MESDLIYDVGMYDGADTAFYLAKGFRVVAVEANPALVEQAKARFAAPILDGSLTLVERAIGRRASRVEFFVHKRTEDWSTLNSGVWPPSDVRRIWVDCVTFDEVLRQHGIPYYLKIDVEGSDLDAIKALEGFSERPRYVSAEAQTPEIVDALYDLGYRDFKLVDQDPRRRSALPWIAKEGRYVHLAFGWHHSGPFGEETPGKWKTREQALVDHRGELAGGAPSWYDFHARLPTTGSVSRHRTHPMISICLLPQIAARHALRGIPTVVRNATAAVAVATRMILRSSLPAPLYDWLKATYRRRRPLSS